MSHLLLIVMLLGAYTVVVLAIGGIARWRSREDTEEDYFVAGRTFNLFVLFFTYEATLFSMWFFMGTGGFWYTHGMGFYCHVLWMTMSGLLLWWLGTRIWLCGKKWNFVTPADLLAHRYGSEVYRVIVALVSAGFIFPYILLQIKGGGLLLEAASGGVIPFWQGAGLMLLVVVIYTVVGGARAVAWTDAAQGFVFLTIIWAIAIGAAIKIGGGLDNMFVRMQELSAQHLTLPGPAHKFNYAWWFSFWFVQGIALGNAGVWMRIYSANSPTTLRRTGALIPIAGTLGYLATFLYAYSAITDFPSLENPDQLLPEMLKAYWPALMLPMIVGAFAAGMSTSDSQLLAGSAICTSDIYKRYIYPTANQRHLVWVGRAFVLLFTLAAYLVSLAKTPTLLVQLGVICYAGTANLAVPLVGAFFWKRATAKGAIVGTLAGVLVLLFLDPKTNPMFETDPFSFHPGFIALVVNAVLFVLISLGTTHGRQERHEEYAEFMAESYSQDAEPGAEAEAEQAAAVAQATEDDPEDTEADG
jgi:SSS family solute:Na+ symporter